MRSSLRIGRIFGIGIYLHATWFLIFFLLTYSLAQFYFPEYYDFSAALDWVLAFFSALLLFLSVLMHELSHSIVSKKEGMEVESITLFFFGGVAAASAEETSPKSEFLLAAAGPLFSAVLGLVFLALYALDIEMHLTAIFDYLYKINFILAVFNLIPAYPLDGGRILRSILWAVQKDIRKATLIASKGGVLFGYMLMFLGIAGMFAGGGSVWYILIGAFLVFLANESYRQLIIKENLKKISLDGHVMKKTLIDKDLPLSKFFDWCVANHLSFGIVKEREYFIADIDKLNDAQNIGSMKVKDIMQ